jgi:hypothetical protein
MNEKFIETAFIDVMAELRALREAVAPPASEYQLVPLPLSGEGGLKQGEDALNSEASDGWQVIAVVPKIGKTPSLAGVYQG